MTDAGSTPSASVSSVRPGASSSAPNARIEAIPSAFGQLKQPVRTEGEVIRHNEDGTLRIRTPQGDMDVRIVRDRNQPAPQPGQKVEVQIQPGNPPRQADVRLPAQTPSQPQPAQTQPAPAQPASPQPLPAQPAPASAPAPSTPVTGQPVPAQPQAPSGTATLPAPLPPATYAPPPAGQPQVSPVLLPDTAVRLVPLSPAQLTQLAAATETPLEQFMATIKTPALASPGSASPLPAAGQSPAPPTTLPTVPATQPPLLQNLLHPPLTPQPATPLPGTPASALTPLMAKTGLSTPETPALTTASPPGLQMPGQIAAQPAPLSRLSFLDVFVKSIMQAPAPGTPSANAPRQGGGPAALLPALLTTPVQAGQVPALVIGQAPGSLPIVALWTAENQTPQIFLLQHSATNIRPGQILALQPGQASPLPDLASLPRLQDILSFKQWPALDDLIEILTHAPVAARQGLNVMPNAANPAQMGPALLFFVAAMRAGDANAWLGDKITDWLRGNGKAEIIRRLGQDMTALARLSPEPVGQDWRGLSVPLLWQTEISKINLYYRETPPEPGDDDKSRQKSGSHRFILDLSLDRMGDIQLDGYFRPGRLDLAVRTQSPFSKAMQQSMRAIYLKSLSQIQLTGDILFQSNPELFVRIGRTRHNLTVSA